MDIHISFIIIVIICVIWIWYMTCCTPHLVSKSFESLNFKTGDIILFHAWDNNNPIFIGSYWGHIGIVYKDPDNLNQPLLFEAARTSEMKYCPDDNKHGIMITDLKSRLEKYPGLIACKFLNKQLETNIINGFHEFINYSRVHMYYNNNIIYNSFKKKNGEVLNTSTNCGELVTLSLIKLGLIPIDILHKKIAHHLLYNVKLTNVIKNHYLNPIEVIFNPF